MKPASPSKSRSTGSDSASHVRHCRPPCESVDPADRRWPSLVRSLATKASGRRVSAVKPLKYALALNGVVFLVRAGTNLLKPTSWYVDANAPQNAVDAVHVIGITYAALGLIQIGMWRVSDRRAVRAVSGASFAFAAGMAGKALSQGSGPADAFHRMRYASAAENAGVAVLYAVLLSRDCAGGN